MEELVNWEDYDHPLSDSYGRKLVFEDGFFEIMVMSWAPGDVSAIHDHGYTQWGAVQIFGPAEHSTFMVQDDAIVTISRKVMEPGRVIPVGHQLVHQMGNQSEQKFLTLHVYGVDDLEFNRESVTADARVWDITEGVVQRTNGGVFFALPQKQINAVEAAPIPNYMSWLRNTLEYIRRVRKANRQKPEEHLVKIEQKLTSQIFDISRWNSFESELMAHVDNKGHVTNPSFWQLLRGELIQAARLQNELLGMESESEDSFYTYAELYDEVIGQPCLTNFTGKYIKFVHDIYNLDFSASRILSIGCGTGLMEEHILQTYNLHRDNLLGIDISEAMVEVASKKINAVVKDIVALDPTEQLWDITFASLNVFQYLPQTKMGQAIENVAQITRKGGYFVGDFVTPDHMRWYPDVIRSENVISLREPLFVEKNHNIHQQSEIINVSKLHGKLRITYEGKHIRYLPSLWKMRYLFNKFFGSQVDVFDAVTLEPLKAEDDTCPSTRYLVVAQKG